MDFAIFLILSFPLLCVQPALAREVSTARTSWLSLQQRESTQSCLSDTLPSTSYVRKGANRWSNRCLKELKSEARVFDYLSTRHTNLEYIVSPSRPCFVTGKDIIRLNGTRVILYGDSVMRQMYQAMICSFVVEKVMSVAKVKYDIFETESCRAAPVSCREIRFHNSEFSICLIRVTQRLFFSHDATKGLDRMCATKTFFTELRSDDVVIANVGLWFNPALNTGKNVTVQTSNKLYVNVKQFFDTFNTTFGFRKKRPLLLWRETTQQHWKSRFGGAFDHGLESQYRRRNSCKEYNIDLKRLHNFRNAAVVSLTKEYKIPVIPVWIASATAGASAHRGDCTHFGFHHGSLLDIFNIILIKCIVHELKSRTD